MQKDSLTELVLHDPEGQLHNKNRKESYYVIPYLETKIQNKHYQIGEYSLSGLSFKKSSKKNKNPLLV